MTDEKGESERKRGRRRVIMQILWGVKWFFEKGMMKGDKSLSLALSARKKVKKRLQNDKKQQKFAEK